MAAKRRKRRKKGTPVEPITIAKAGLLKRI